MPITVACDCGRELKARDEFAGTRAECPYCGSELTIPPLAPDEEPDPALQEKAETFVNKAATARSSAARPAPMEIRDFLDPPAGKPTPSPPVESEPVLQRMLQALLDPRAIQWLLMLGGALFVLGLIVWLVSINVFDDPRTVAVALGVGSLAVLGAGWYTTLKTRHTTAGHAVTFLGCVVLPLNLWFYHAQDLFRLEDHLWLGGLVCVAFYVLTVYLLRSPLFLYAVEAGLTLTVLLLMADLGQMNSAADFCFWFDGAGIRLDSGGTWVCRGGRIRPQAVRLAVVLVRTGPTGRVPADSVDLPGRSLVDRTAGTHLVRQSAHGKRPAVRRHLGWREHSSTSTPTSSFGT